jgi:hypothetical protein
MYVDMLRAHCCHLNLRVVLLGNIFCLPMAVFRPLVRFAYDWATSISHVRNACFVHIVAIKLHDSVSLCLMQRVEHERMRCRAEDVR